MEYFNNEDGSKLNVSFGTKNKNKKQWYKDHADRIGYRGFSRAAYNSTLDEESFSDPYKTKKVNYDLFNNILNLSDFDYVCKPYGDKVGNLPATMVNRDIVSGKIKALLGMEMKMPFDYKIVAVNEEATSRKEAETFKRIQQFAINQIIGPIRQELEVQAEQQHKGDELDEKQKQQIQQEINQQLDAQTPDEVRRYMAREHQDPAEALANQLLEYTIRKQGVKEKFNKGWKHATLSGEEIYYVGVLGNGPIMRVVNPLYFDFDRSPDSDYIEDGEWACCEYRMTPSEIISNFSSELSKDDIDKIYDLAESSAENGAFDFAENYSRYEAGTHRVLHTVWKAPAQIGFLTYIDSEGENQMTMVREGYRLNKEYGDVSIEWETVVEVYETWKIAADIYCYMRPVPGQFRDMEDLDSAKLPYYGAAYDNMNSQSTSIMDRMRPYQYYYNIIMYNLERLMASDKGKKFAMNIGAISKSTGLDLEKTLYFMDATGILPINPNEEGNKGGGEVTNMIKEIDMSLISDIQKYQLLAEYTVRQCGMAVGITAEIEGGAGPDQSVGNSRQNIIQSSYVIQPYFEMHNLIKGNVLTALLECCKIAYSGEGSKKLAYVLDDMSLHMLTVNEGLLDSSKYGLFLSNAWEAKEAKDMVQQLAQAALQNQRADLSDIIKVMRAESVQEAEELMEVSEAKKNKEMQQAQQQQGEQAQRLEELKEMSAQKQHERDKELVVLKETERRKTEIQKQAILSIGFDTEKDRDGDGEPDVLEVAKHGLNAEIQSRKLALEEDKLAHKKEVDKEKLAIDKKKASQKPKSN